MREPTMGLAFVLIDGIGDVSIPELGNRTPLEAAHCPNLDAIAGVPSADTASGRIQSTPPPQTHLSVCLSCPFAAGRVAEDQTLSRPLSMHWASCGGWLLETSAHTVHMIEATPTLLTPNALTRGTGKGAHHPAPGKLNHTQTRIIFVESSRWVATRSSNPYQSPPSNLPPRSRCACDDPMSKRLARHLGHLHFDVPDGFC